MGCVWRLTSVAAVLSLGRRHTLVPSTISCGGAGILRCSFFVVRPRLEVSSLPISHLRRGRFCFLLLFFGRRHALVPSTISCGGAGHAEIRHLALGEEVGLSEVQK
jgi:hypothetical protein